MANYEVQRNGAPIGVFAPGDLKAAALNGTVLPTDQVRPEGGSQWVDAGSVNALDFPAPTKSRKVGGGSVGFVPHIFALWIDRLVNWLKMILSAKRFIDNMHVSERLGHFGLLGVMALSVILGVIIAIKVDSLQFFLQVGGVVVALAITQYVAWRFIGASRNLLESTPTTINGTVLLDVIGIVLVALALAAFGYGIYEAIELSSFATGVAAVIILVVGLLAGCVAFNPELLNIQISGQASAGEEAVGLLSFFVKCILVLAPFVYFGGAIVAIFGLFEGLYWTLTEEMGVIAGMVYFIYSPAVMVAVGFYSLVFYVVFLVYYLIVDVLSSILGMGRDVKEIAGRD